MTGCDNEFRVLMDRVLAGNEEAARRLLAQYGPPIRHAVRRRLNKLLRSKFDSLDFVQDVWASFFAAPPREHLFKEPENLVAFLTRVAQNKVVDATRRRMQGTKYNVNLERSLDHSVFGGPETLPARQPTPSEVVSGDEQWDRLLSDVPIVYRRVLILLREGKSQAEIAEELQIGQRTIRRIVGKLLPRLTS